jgi:hypothetical protein
MKFYTKCMKIGQVIAEDGGQQDDAEMGRDGDEVL